MKELCVRYPNSPWINERALELIDKVEPKN